MRLTVGEIAEAVGGTVSVTARSNFTEDSTGNSVHDNAAVTSVSTDSREIEPGSLFIALRGNNFDGHDHVLSARDKGAVCALVESDTLPRVDAAQSAGELPAAEQPNDTAESISFILIRVASTHKALLDLAAYYRRRLNVKIVAVTGSAGKTSTKDMIAEVLSARYKTLKTPGNRNNLIGLPLTLLTLDESHEAAVLEMGMNHFGEIHELSLTAAPDICVITNIGDAHIEFLGSREGILKAKLEITDGMKPGGTLVLNGGDPLLAGLSEEFPRAVYCHVDDDSSAVHASHIEPLGLSGVKFRLYMGTESRGVYVPAPGAHTVTNALLAAAVGREFGLTVDEIAEGIAAFVPTGRRMAVHEANGMRVIDDAYNANPASIRAAVSVLAGITDAKRRVCILGDMLELGGHSARLHKETGEYIAESGIDLLIAVGDNARYYVVENSVSYCSLYFKDNDSFLAHWREILRPGDAVLVKASLGMRFNEIIQGVLA